jgi:hypothetical protein
MKSHVSTVGLLRSWLCIPPPKSEPVFPLKVQLITVGLLAALTIPPPLSMARFSSNTQLDTVGLLPP